MATTLFDRVFKGSDEMYDVAVKALEEASAKYPDSEPIAFPDTAYYLACIYAMTGQKITNLGELKSIMNWIKGQMGRRKKTRHLHFRCRYCLCSRGNRSM